MATRNPARKPVDMENLPLFTVLFLYVRWCRISSIYGISQYGESSSNGVNSILRSCIENHRESQLFVMNVVGLRESYIFWLQKPRLPPKKLRHKNLDKENHFRYFRRTHYNRTCFMLPVHLSLGPHDIPQTSQ